jgi:anti-sigma B factor antagonist
MGEVYRARDTRLKRDVAGPTGGKMPFALERSDLDSGVTVLAVSGAMTMGDQLQALERVILELARTNRNRIVLEMSRISYLDSSAIGVLIGCHGSVRTGGGQLRLAGVPARVREIFKMTGVDKVLNVDATRDDSVAALSAGA